MTLKDQELSAVSYANPELCKHDVLLCEITAVTSDCLKLLF